MITGKLYATRLSFRGSNLLAAKSKIEEAVEWYKANFIVYERLTNHVEAILKDILKKEKAKSSALVPLILDNVIVSIRPSVVV